MSKLLRHRWGLDRPPPGPFTINHESDQAIGLVLWMPHGGGDPGTTRHVDRVRGLTFTEGGTPTWVLDAERGWTLLLDDGASEYLGVDQAVITAPPLTMAGWVNLDDATVNQCLLWTGDKDVDNRWGVALAAMGGVANDPIRVYQYGAGGVTNASTSSGYSANTRHHLCTVVTSTTNRAVFIDSGSKGTDAADCGDTGTWDHISIGRTGDSTPGWYVSGRIHDVRIYNRALTDAEVWQLYDPLTRWELYKPTRRLWQAVSPAAAGAIPPLDEAMLSGGLQPLSGGLS